jgi:hypothetical protein
VHALTSFRANGRKPKHGGQKLTQSEDVELSFLTAYRLIYEHSPEGIARREAQEPEQAAQSADLMEALLAGNV